MITANQLCISSVENMEEVFVAYITLIRTLQPHVQDSAINKLLHDLYLIKYDEYIKKNILYPDYTSPYPSHGDSFIDDVHYYFEYNPRSSSIDTTLFLAEPKQ